MVKYVEVRCFFTSETLPSLSPGLRVSGVIYMYVVFRIRYMIAGRKMLTVMCAVVWICRFLCC